MARLINDSGVLGDTMTVTAKNINTVSFDKIIEAIHVVQENLGIAGTSSEEAAGTIQGSAGSIKAAWSNLVTALADPNADLSEHIDNFVNSAIVMGENMIPAFERALEGVGRFIEGMATAIAEKLPEIIENDLPKWIDSGVSALMALIQGITNSIPQLVKAVNQLIPVIVKTVTQNLPVILNAGLEILVGLAEGIVDALPELIPAIVECIATITDALTNPDMLTQLLDVALDLLMTLADGLIDAIPQLVDATIQIIENLIRFLVEPQNIAKIINAGIKVTMALQTGLLNALPKLAEGALKLVLAIGDTIVHTDWLQVGKNIVDGLWDGLKHSWNSLQEWFSNAVNGLVDGIKGWLGIHSPSTVFAKIGGYMAEGLGEGWQDEFADVKDDIEDGLDFNANSISTNISGTNTYKNSSSGVGMGGNNIYFYFNIDKVSGNKEDIEENADLLMQIFTEKMSRMGVVFA